MNMFAPSSPPALSPLSAPLSAPLSSSSSSSSAAAPPGGPSALAPFTPSLSSGASPLPFDAFNQTQEAGLAASLSRWISFDNTVSKIIFTVALVLVLFLLLRIALAIVLFLWPAEDSPYLVSGVLQGTSSLTIAQDPAKQSGKLVARSRDQDMGMEFTWSVWLFIDSAEIRDRTVGKTEYAVFTKGNPKTQNGPGLYVGRETQQNSEANVAFLKVKMDLHGKPDPEEIKVTRLPLQKWFHVAVRLQNKELDVYVNGTVTEHRVLDNVPQQNYADVFVFPTDLNSNGGERFAGYLSDLVYFPYALNIYRLNAVVLGGPSTHLAAANATSLVKGKDSDYMSPAWYAAQTN